MALPQLVLTIITGSLTSVLVPLLANEEGSRFYLTAWSFLQSIGLVFTGITLLLFLTATIWVPWIAPGFDSQAASLTISLVRIQLLGIVFMALTSVLWSVN